MSIVTCAFIRRQSDVLLTRAIGGERAGHLENSEAVHRFPRLRAIQTKTAPIPTVNRDGA